MAQKVVFVQGLEVQISVSLTRKAFRKMEDIVSLAEKAIQETKPAMIDLIIIGSTNEDEGELSDCLKRDVLHLLSSFSVQTEVKLQDSIFIGSTGCDKDLKTVTILFCSQDLIKLGRLIPVFYSCFNGEIEKNHLVTRTIFYCGHGSIDGCVFCGDIIRIEDFYEILNTKEGYLDKKDMSVHFYLNCCFALSLASRLGRTDYLALFTTAFQGREKTILDVEGWKLVNDDYSRLLRNIIGRPGDTQLNVVPLSVGPISYIGNIGMFLKNAPYRTGVTLENEPVPLEFRATATLWGDKISNELKPGNDADILSAVDIPTVDIFDANNGDSFLFRFDNWNLVVDGGEYKKPKCWNLIKNLRSYSLLLTHPDLDHANGMFFLAAAEKYRRKHEQRFPCLENAFFAHNESLPKEFRAWSYLNSLRNELPNDMTPGYPNKYSRITTANGSIIHMIRVLPTTDKIGNQRESLASYLVTRVLSTSGTMANQTGLVLLLLTENPNGDSVKSFLFCGDAHGDHIVDRLNSLWGSPIDPDNPDSNTLSSYFFKGVKIIDCVTVPHHGSRCNKFENLIGSEESKFQARNYIVSSSGTRHKHPHDEVVRILAEQIVSDTQSHVYFSHETNASKKIMDYLDPKFHKRVHFKEKNDMSLSVPFQ